MLDLVYVAVIVIFFAVALGYARACDRGQAGRRAGLGRLRVRVAAVQRGRRAGDLRHRAAPERAAVQPAGAGRRAAGPGLQHGRQLHHQHQLAELRPRRRR